MDRNRRYTPISVSELLVRTSLPNLFESKPVENTDHLARLQNGQPRHPLSQVDPLDTDELDLHLRLAIL